MKRRRRSCGVYGSRAAIVFEILSRNTSMLRLAARAQGTITTLRDEDVVHVTALFPDRGNTSRSPLPDSQDAQARQRAAERCNLTHATMELQFLGQWFGVLIAVGSSSLGGTAAAVTLY